MYEISCSISIWFHHDAVCVIWINVQRRLNWIMNLSNLTCVSFSKVVNPFGRKLGGFFAQSFTKPFERFLCVETSVVMGCFNTKGYGRRCPRPVIISVVALTNIVLTMTYFVKFQSLLAFFVYLWDHKIKYGFSQENKWNKEWTNRLDAGLGRQK